MTDVSHQNLRLGAAYAVIAAGAFASMGAMVKLAAPELPTTMVVFLRTSLSLLCLLPWLLRAGTGGLTTQRPGMHALRIGIGLSAMYCFFYAIAKLPLANAVLLNYSQPLFIPFVAWLWVSERPPLRIFPAVLIGFVGVAMILKPDTGVISIPGLIALCAGILSAFTMTSIRRMSDTEPAVRIVFYFTVMGALISAIPAAINWQTPSLAAFVAMLAAGVFATAGQLLLTRAYALAPAAHVGSLVYTAVVFAAIWGWALWDEAPDWMSGTGALLVIIAAIIVVFTRRNTSQARQD